MAVYQYRCDLCIVDIDVERPMGQTEPAPACTSCGFLTRRFIAARAAQICARPWYDKPGVTDPVWTNMSATDKLEKRKQWEKDADDSWEGATPSKSDYKTTSAVDIYNSLTPEAVHKELASMAASE